MMGPEQRSDPKLFYFDVNLEDRIPARHVLRRVREVVDFSFVRARVGHLYGTRGNPSVDPVVLLKLMFLLYFENVRSERALMEQLPLRLDWLWFCGYDLDDTVPDHSVISKARRRWGAQVFEELFEQVLTQCVQAGLVGGEVVHLDASVITANASKDRLRPELRRVGQTLYATLEKETGAATASVGPPADGPPGPPPGTPVSPADPDARLTQARGRSVLGYKDHRVVDDHFGIITATLTTDASCAEARLLTELLDAHTQHTGRRVKTVVADKGYGTSENYRALQERQAKACIPHPQQTAPERMFPHAAFDYDPARDCYRCPAGQELPLLRREPGRNRHRYRAAPGVCAACPLRSQCTTNPAGRTVGRNLLQEYVDWADSCFTREHRRRLLRRRKFRAEGSFADAANNHGYKRARWRGLGRVRIQHLLIGMIQNVRKLLQAGPARKAPQELSRAAATLLHRMRAWLSAASKPATCPR